MHVIHLLGMMFYHMGDKIRIYRILITPNLFDVKAIIKGIPLELFLQIVGSTVKVDNMMEKFKKGVCLCDLSIQEYNDLNDTPAIRRLSSVVSIL